MLMGWLLAAGLAASPDPASIPDVGADALPAPEQVLAIPGPLREALQRQVIAHSPVGEQRLQRLIDFMLGADGLGLSYQPDADLTVGQAWETRRANCLSFTLLVVALAREAGFDAHGQEISRTLSWYSEGDTVYFSNHVNAGIRFRNQRYTVDVASDSVLTARPPATIDDRRLLAIYYSNRAAALVAQGRLAAAAAHIEAALHSDERYASAWNNAGVLRLREGRARDAERAFLHALSLDKAHDGAMVNLASLYANRGDHARQAEYNRRIARTRQRNPFHYFMLALDDEKRGDHAQAAMHYRRAIALYDGEHRFHAGLARAYLHLGKARKAGEALRQAHAISDGATRDRYQAKLDRLRQLER